MPFLNHRLRTLQTESFRNLDAAFSPSLFLFLSLNFVPKYLKISFLPLCIYKNVEKNRAKTGHFLLQFLPSNHNILWSNMPIFPIFHNTASELPTQHAQSPGTYPRSIPSSPHTPSPAALQDLSPGWSVCRRYTPSAAHHSG